MASSYLFRSEQWEKHNLSCSGSLSRASNILYLAWHYCQNENQRCSKRVVWCFNHWGAFCWRVLLDELLYQPIVAYFSMLVWSLLSYPVLCWVVFGLKRLYLGSHMEMLASASRITLLIHQRSLSLALFLCSSFASAPPALSFSGFLIISVFFCCFFPRFHTCFFCCVGVGVFVLSLSSNAILTLFPSSPCLYMPSPDRCFITLHNTSKLNCFLLINVSSQHRCELSLTSF